MIQATDPQAIAIAKLAEMISQTTAFRTRREEWTPEEALPHIHVPWIDDPEQTARPYCVLTDEDDDNRLEADRTFSNGGSIGLVISDYADLIEDQRNSLVDFRNFAGGVKSELLEMSGVNTHLQIVSINRIAGPMISGPKETVADGMAQRDFWEVSYMVVWRNFGT